jgi:hypothetical protein
MQRYEISASVRIGAQASAQARHSTIPFDGSAEQKPNLPEPAESLALAFAACALKNVKRFSRIPRLRYESASIPAAAKIEQRPSCIVSIRHPLRVASGEREHRVALLHTSLHKFGGVYSALAGACRLQGEIFAEQPERCDATTANPELSPASGGAREGRRS